MSLWRQITRGTRTLANRSAADQEVNDEVAHYLDQAAAELVARGLSPEAARRQARLDLGSATAVREQVRSSGWENVVETLAADLHYAGRRLWSNPGFTAVCALTLALGIGASTAIFSAVNPILFEPLPYPHANRIVMIWDIFQGERSDVTFHTYRELKTRSHSFDSVAAYEGWQPTMTSAAEPARFDGQSVSWQYFRTLGVAPALGRDFIESDNAFHGPNVAILSEALWRRRFGASGTIVGRAITLDGDTYTIIGVMPRGFEDVPAPSTEIWSAMQYDPGHIEDQKSTEWGHHLRLLGRLQASVSLDTVRRDLNAIARTPVAEFPRPRSAATSSSRTMPFTAPMWPSSATGSGGGDLARARPSLGARSRSTATATPSSASCRAPSKMFPRPQPRSGRPCSTIRGTSKTRRARSGAIICDCSAGCGPV